MLHTESRLLVQLPFKQENQFTAEFTSRASPPYLDSGLNIQAGQSFISTADYNSNKLPTVTEDNYDHLNPGFSGVQQNSRSSSTGSGSDQGSAGSSGSRRKSYGCEICPAMFGSKMELEEHSNSHTGEKPFECDVCNARFNRRSTLWNHKRIHSDQKPFRCPICSMHFKWKNSLKCHKEMHLRKNETGPLDAEEFRIQLLSPSKRGRTARGGSRKRGGSATAAASSNISVSPLVNGRGNAPPARAASPDFSMLEDPTGYSAAAMMTSQDTANNNSNSGQGDGGNLMQQQQQHHQTTTTYHNLTPNTPGHMTRHPAPGISQEGNGSGGSSPMHHSMGHPQQQQQAPPHHHDTAHPHLVHHLGQSNPSPSSRMNHAPGAGGGGQSILQQALQQTISPVAVHHQAHSGMSHDHQQEQPQPQHSGPSYQIYVQNLPDVKPSGLLQPISSVAAQHQPQQPQHILTSYNHPTHQQGHEVVITASQGQHGGMKLSPPTGATPLQTSRGESPIASGGTVRHTQAPSNGLGHGPQHIIHFLNSNTPTNGPLHQHSDDKNNNNALAATTAASTHSNHVMGGPTPLYSSAPPTSYHNHMMAQSAPMSHHHQQQQQMQSNTDTAGPRLTGLDHFAASLLNPHPHSPNQRLSPHPGVPHGAPQPPPNQQCHQTQHNSSRNGNNPRHVNGTPATNDPGDYMPNVDFIMATSPSYVNGGVNGVSYSSSPLQTNTSIASLLASSGAASQDHNGYVVRELEFNEW